MLDDFPDCAVGDVVVFVDYSVSKADDGLVAGDLFGDGLVVVGESSCGFADDFELGVRPRIAATGLLRTLRGRSQRWNR